MVNLTKLERLTRSLREYTTHLENLGQLDRSAVLTAPADCERLIQLIFDYVQATDEEE